MRSHRRILGNLLLALAVSIACFGAAEVVLRVLAERRSNSLGEGLEALAAVHEPPPFRGDCTAPESQASLGDIVQPSSIPDLVYELKPNLDTCFYGAHVQTNSSGLRADVDYERPRPEGVHRIALLGDSQAFGQGVEFSETFGQIVVRELLRRYATPIEVLNMGVDGYNTVQEAAVLRYKALSYEPSCVVVLFIANDFELPAFLHSRKPQIVLRSRRSYLLDGVAGLWREMTGRRPVDEFEPLTLADPQVVPTEYRHMVGREAYRRALADMAALTSAAGIRLVNLANYSLRRSGPWHQLRRWQESLGVVMPSFSLPYGPTYWLSDENRHLNSMGHRVLAHRVLAAFDEAGVCLP